MSGYKSGIHCALLASVLVSGSHLCEATSQATPSIVAPLQVLKSNPRFLTDGSGKAIYMAGVNGWQTFEDFSPINPPPAYDWTADLDEATANGYNFIRLWTVEQEAWGDNSIPPGALGLHGWPLPWTRVGTRSLSDPGVMLVGVYDLNSFNQAFFDRLRTRVQSAHQKGIYVSIMLFSGGHLSYSSRGWFSHPFNAANNINSINGDKNADGKGTETHTLHDPVVTALQEAYVKKVIETVNDLPNVIYEISNEDKEDTTPWQNHMADLIHDYESTDGRQRHPVWISAFGWGVDMLSNNHLYSTHAEIISPTNLGGENYDTDPPASGGGKVVFVDSDHIGTETHQWPWKVFTRGNYPVFLDERETPSVRAAIKKTMGQTVAYANKVDLAAMIPAVNTAICSTGYCLINPGSEYLMYLPSGGPATINLGGVSGTFAIEFFSQETGETTNGGTVSGETVQSFSPPFEGEAVVHLKAVMQNAIPSHAPINLTVR